MHLQSLLNIEPDKLFEKSSIQEIEDVQKKLQNEIERKREEIRTMVGERYRDLIEAADTISEMKLLSKKAIDDVNKMRKGIMNLQEGQDSGFKIEYQNKDTKNNAWACVASQIKVLIDISKHIWEAVDQADFIKATLLFLLARYIKTSLEINSTFKAGKYFPVVFRQWSSIVHFKDTILRGAEETLKSQHLSQVTCSCLVSIALLEKLTSSQLLERYLALRSEALQAVLAPHQSLDSNGIKQRLCDSYTLLVNSIIAISHCFIEHVQAKEGLLWKELNSHVGLQAPPTLHLLESETSHISVTLLPSAIKEFRPVLNQPLELLPENQVHEAISEWLVWVRGLVRDRGSHLLQKLSSLRGLQGLRDAPMVSEEWLLVAQKLLGLPNVDLWNESYRSLITVRAQQLVSVHWDAAIKALHLQIGSAFNAACTESKMTEVNLVWYMWKECTTDLNNLNDHKSAKGLWLKSKGVTPRVAELCGGLERKISSLLSDLGTLCPEQEVDPALLAISNTLKVHQQRVCADLVTRLVHFVKDMSKDTDSEAGAIVLAKFLQSMPELCPSISKCLSSVDAKGVSWQESHSLIQAECLAVYRTWLSLASTRILKHVTGILGSSVPDLHSIPQWEEIMIEEEGETGEKLQSVLRVPSGASLTLQSALHQLASVIGHAAVPKQISEQLVDSVLTTIVNLHKKNIESSLTQTQYLQSLLDVKYMAHLFNSSSNKDLKTLYQETISSLESKIDPFDLNVFTPYINENVKLSVQRTQALLGVAGTGVGTALPSHRSEEPNVLALSSSATTWFPLLHITAPRVSQTPVKPKGKKSSALSTATNPSLETGAKPSGATSFFGVMATDWFG